MKIISLLTTIILVIACNPPPTISPPQTLVQEINSLTTDESKSAYLEAIWDLDQKIRTDEDSVLLLYGHGSKEYEAHWDFIGATDLLNLQKIEMYLATYGYPKKGVHSEKAIGTPWIVIHHQSINEPRRKNFRYLQDAYKAGDLDGSAFTFFLNRFYEQEFGHRLELSSPFTEEVEIDKRVKSLGFSE